MAHERKKDDLSPAATHTRGTQGDTTTQTETDHSMIAHKTQQINSERPSPG
jgi:hypothetical protein